MHKLMPVLGLLPLSAVAHPGDHHMGAMAALAHFVSQADHLPLLLVVIVGGFLLAARLNRKN